MDFDMEDIKQYIGEFWLVNKAQRDQIAQLLAENEQLKAEIERLREIKKPPGGG
jgi:cell division protein FtsB